MELESSEGFLLKVWLMLEEVILIYLPWLLAKTWVFLPIVGWRPLLLATCTSPKGFLCTFTTWQLAPLRPSDLGVGARERIEHMQRESHNVFIWLNLVTDTSITFYSYKWFSKYSPHSRGGKLGSIEGRNPLWPQIIYTLPTCKVYSLPLKNPKSFIPVEHWFEIWNVGIYN